MRNRLVPKWMTLTFVYRSFKVTSTIAASISKTTWWRRIIQTVLTSCRCYTNTKPTFMNLALGLASVCLFTFSFFFCVYFLIVCVQAVSGVSHVTAAAPPTYSDLQRRIMARLGRHKTSQSSTTQGASDVTSTHPPASDVIVSPTSSLPHLDDPSNAQSQL